VASPSILACEDDPLFGALLNFSFRKLGLPLQVVTDGKALDETLERESPDILLLDLGLPGEDGLSIARRIRRRHPHLGIVMITGRGHLEDRVQGFREGADLYFVKPVDIRELEAAIRNLHRRLVAPPPVRGAWSLHAGRSVLVTPLGLEVPLTHNEQLFLTRLLNQLGTAVVRDDLMVALGYAPDPTGGHRLETLVSRLRLKARQVAPDEPLPIQARHGCGYAFLEPALAGKPQRGASAS
jgi:DNA-binding response OmpR family regulator